MILDDTVELRRVFGMLPQDKRALWIRSVKARYVRYVRDAQLVGDDDQLVLDECLDDEISGERLAAQTEQLSRLELEIKRMTFVCYRDRSVIVTRMNAYLAIYTLATIHGKDLDVALSIIISSTHSFDTLHRRDESDESSESRWCCREMERALGR